MANINYTKPNKLEDFSAWCSKKYPLWCKTNFPFIEDTFEALDTYGLICKIVQYLNEIKQNLNTTEDNVQNIYNFVTNYFDNLDVQNEINNKLDEMASSGVLQEIISSYLQTKAVFGFNNVEEMKNAENLIAGSFAKTLGYYSINDGGSANYKIRNRTFDDIIDNGSIILLNNESLVAELIIKNEINVKQFGAIGDGITDDSISIQTAINTLKLKNIGKFIFNKGVYYLENGIAIENINNIVFENYGVFHRKSSETRNQCFLINYCDNCEFNNFYIYSERDKEEKAPAGHTRIDYSGSNIIGLFTHYLSNSKINNLHCENLYFDIMNQNLSGEDESKRSENIIIDNWFSRNSSMPIYASHLNNFKVINCDFIVAENLGDGDHFLYFGNDCKDIYVKDSKFIAPDIYLGVGINFREANYNTDERAPQNLFIENVEMTGVEFVSSKANSEIHIDNSIFKQLNGTEKYNYSQQMRIFNVNARNKLFVNNFIAYDITGSIFHGTDTVEMIIENSIFYNKGTSYLISFDQTAISENPKSRQFLNCAFYDIRQNFYLCPDSKYVVNDLFKNCIITVDKNNEFIGSYLFNLRNSSSRLKIIDCIIKNENENVINTLCFNSGVSEVATLIANTLIYKFTKISTSMTSFKVLNSYINDEIVIQ